jgi:hypothetical protein
MERVVSRNEEPGEVGQELTSKVKEDQEKVDESDTSDDIDLGGTWCC